MADVEEDLCDNYGTKKAIQASLRYTSEDDQWQTRRCSIKERNKYMFDNELLSDVHFLVGKNDRRLVPAHKYVLSISSPVFFSLFYSYGALAQEQKDQIELFECEASSFKEMLRYLYCDEVRLTGSNAPEVMYLARKYLLPDLEDFCLDYITESLNPENALSILDQCRLLVVHRGVETECWRIIDTNAEIVFANNSLVDISFATLSLLLQRDTLAVMEANLFKAVMRWANKECIRQNIPVNVHNQRQVLGEALYYLRLPLMTEIQFTEEVARSGLLTHEEVANMYIGFNSSFDQEDCKVQFPTTPRDSSSRELKPLSRSVRNPHATSGDGFKWEDTEHKETDMSAMAGPREREIDSDFVTPIKSVDSTSSMRLKSITKDHLVVKFDKEEPFDCSSKLRASEEINMGRGNMQIIEGKEEILTSDIIEGQEDILAGGIAANWKEGGSRKETFPLAYVDVSLKTNAGETVSDISDNAESGSPANLTMGDNLFGNSLNLSHGNNFSVVDSNKANIKQESSLFVQTDDSKLSDNYAESVTDTRQESVRTQLSCPTAGSTQKNAFSFTTGLITNSSKKDIPNRNSSPSNAFQVKLPDGSLTTTSSSNRKVPRKVRVFSIDPNHKTLPGNTDAEPTANCKDASNTTTASSSEKLIEEESSGKHVSSRCFSKSLNIIETNCLSERFDVERSSNSFAASKSNHFECSVTPTTDSKHRNIRKKNNSPLSFNDNESTSNFVSSPAKSKEQHIGTRTTSPVRLYYSILFDDFSASATHSKKTTMKRKNSSLLNSSEKRSPHASTTDSRKMSTTETTLGFAKHSDQNLILDSLSPNRCTKRDQNIGSLASVNDVCVQTPDWTSLKNANLGTNVEANDQSCSCSSRSTNDTTVALSHDDNRFDRKPLKMARLKIFSLSKCFIVSSVEKYAE